MLNLINKKMIFPLYFYLNKDKRLQRLKELEKNQWLSQDEIIAGQFKSFMKSLRYAYRYVPYYKKKYDELGIDIEDIKNIDDIKKLPILTKKDLQENLQDLASTDCPVSQRYEDASGGSTGAPTILYSDLNAIHTKFAASLMADKWTGWDIGEKVAYLWGADQDLNVIRNFKRGLVEKYVFRQITLNAFSITDEKMKNFADLLLREKPALIIAYANLAYMFAEFLSKSGISGIHPKGIITSAETLLPDKREFIESVFQCKVLNRYGSREVGLIASECEHQEGLHINAADVLVELEPIKNEGADAGLSEIIVTEFNSRVMPLIRYNMADVAAPSTKQCGCGRGLPMIESVKGRTSDFILHPDGKLIHGEYFSHAFYHMPGIKQFQLIQKQLDEISIRVVPSKHYSDADERKIRQSIIEALGEVSVAIHEVDEIPPSSSGKYRFAISELIDS